MTLQEQIEAKKQEIEDIKTNIFYEEMADFMNWSLYNELTAKLRIAKQELKELEAKDENIG